MLPGLCDAHVHTLDAGRSEFRAKLPRLGSIGAIQAYIRARAKTARKGEWIVVPRTLPPRLKEMRMPTRDDLDIDRDHPVALNASYVCDLDGTEAQRNHASNAEPARRVIRETGTAGPDGAGNMRWFFPLKSVIDAGIPVAGGSDHMIGHETCGCASRAACATAKHSIHRSASPAGRRCACTLRVRLGYSSPRRREDRWNRANWLTQSLSTGTS